MKKRQAKKTDGESTARVSNLGSPKTKSAKPRRAVAVKTARKSTATDCTSELVRGDMARTPYREHSEAMFLTSSFMFDSASQAADMFARPVAEYVYSRFSNPNIKTLNARVAALENAPAALSTASGMSAILSLIMGTCRAGDSIICGGSIFGATTQLLSNFIAKFGVHIQYVWGDADAWKKAMRRNTKLLLLESPSNPTLEIADITAIADIARRGKALLAVDNCFCPYGQKPLQLGANVVIHSATKYLDGQGRVLGGALAGDEELIYERVYPFLRSGGPALSPFAAWTIVRGMETLPLRMRAHCASALQIAEQLESLSRQKNSPLSKVRYTGLPSHPNNALAMRQQNGMGGGVIALHFRGGRKTAWRFIDGLEQFSITANFGDVKSTVTHPASTTHSRQTAEHRKNSGITEGLVRLSIGLESPEDLAADIIRALKGCR